MSDELDIDIDAIDEDALFAELGLTGDDVGVDDDALMAALLADESMVEEELLKEMAGGDLAALEEFQANQAADKLKQTIERNKREAAEKKRQYVID